MNTQISLVVAADEKNGIGLDNRLLCHLPDDLKFFKKLTMGHYVVMGRKTYESIGKPLPGRKNVILSRNKNYKADGCIVINSLPSLKDFIDDLPETEIYVIGGHSVFEQTIAYAQKIYFTRIHSTFAADTFFPLIDNLEEWKKGSNPDFHGIDEKHSFSFTHLEYKRDKRYTTKSTDFSQERLHL